MAGVDTRQLTPCDDPDHAWVKAVETVSYTHLDVYKRQHEFRLIQISNLIF